MWRAFALLWHTNSKKYITSSLAHVLNEITSISSLGFKLHNMIRYVQINVPLIGLCFGKILSVNMHNFEIAQFKFRTTLGTNYYHYQHSARTHPIRLSSIYSEGPKTATRAVNGSHKISRKTFRPLSQNHLQTRKPNTAGHHKRNWETP
jgi:hypothetical protein